MKIADQTTSGPPRAMAAPGLGWPCSAALAAANPLAAAWPPYLIDALQRSILLLELLRRRGNQEVEVTSRPNATVLRFDHEVLMNGLSLPRPMNYTLSRIVAPDGAVTNPRKRPVVIIDPRAGQGPGIGGFKTESEMGDALRAGHPVYFIGFSNEPAPGQQFLDVVEGQVAFFERIVALHPDAPRPFTFGNCQAGYQTLMVAMLRPDLFGPCLVAGSPMSYWQGVHGKDPMRYAGGLLGGSWLTAMTSDLGCGKFDGTGLVMNFDLLGPANFLWGKQYQIYSTIDTGGERYLAFEKWWGDFIQLNGDELQFLVDNLFIGDKLTRNQLHATDGTVFDVRCITSPIIVFTSTEDNISPPPQTLGWIPDLYSDVAAIRDSGRTIVYCVSHKIGHLAIFVSSKVGAEQDEEFVQLMDVIDCLPPGLFEMVISPRPAELPAGALTTGDWIARFEARSIDDIKALGRNSPADDRAFATVARLSEINLAIYRKFMQPLVRALASQKMADLIMATNPLRLGYTMFADRNPWMKWVTGASAKVAAARKPVAADNPFLAAQSRVSDRIIAALDVYQAARDRQMERVFFGFYGSPVVQALLGIKADSGGRPVPTASPEQIEEWHAAQKAYAAMLTTGGFDAALTRAVLYVFAADHRLDQRCALALNARRQQLLQLSLASFKLLVRNQFFVLQQDCEAAVAALSVLVPETEARRELLRQVEEIVTAAGPPTAAERARLDELSRTFGAPGATTRRNPPAARQPLQPVSLVKTAAA